jgi:hypothetical protein
LKEPNRDIVHSFNTKLSVWRLRYKPPKGKTADCFFISGYKSEAAAVADIPLLTKHLNTNKARISSFKPNLGSLSVADLTEQTILVATPSEPDRVFNTDATHFATVERIGIIY